MSERRHDDTALWVVHVSWLSTTNARHRRYTYAWAESRDAAALSVGSMFAWDVRVRTGAGERRFRHSTLEGMLIDPPDLRRTDPRFRPSLTPRGEARLTVLRLCDGSRTLEEIEQTVFDTHRVLFADGGEAAAFVAEVVTRYSTDGA